LTPAWSFGGAWLTPPSLGNSKKLHCLSI